MSVDIHQQLRALCQAVLLGGGLGVVYDLMRQVRRGVGHKLVGGALDFLFWVVVTAALFLFSHHAWNGRVRLYGAAFCMVGGGVYFLALSGAVRAVLGVLSRMLGKLLRFLTLPLRLGRKILKRFQLFAKNIFSILRKWYMIGLKPKV